MQSVIQSSPKRKLEDITRRAPVLGAALGWFGRYGELALLGLTTLGMMLTIWAAFIYAPTELVEGPVQRIFYVHVPLAWISYLAFFFVLVGSALYLWRRDDRWDTFARVNAEIGTVFTTLVLISGSLWGRAFWGAWWVWDERLTTSLLMWFIYVGYLALRSYTGRTAQGARAAAVVGILGFIVTPINYMSVKWWRTLHPDQVLPLGGTPQLPASMIVALMISLVTFTLLYALLTIEVYKLERAQSDAERLRAEVELSELE
ncbi:MAG TPA: cytochrome c biogenesis protein CcsA [Ktedonobacterales bacterium]|nr:cytochrome c biogenesis protein CcsA [Ktedonobacterales bacterium]